MTSFVFLAHREAAKAPKKPAMRPIKDVGGKVVGHVITEHRHRPGRIYRWELAEQDSAGNISPLGWSVQHCGHATALRPYWMSDDKERPLTHDGASTWRHVAEARSALLEAYQGSLIPRTAG